MIVKNDGKIMLDKDEVVSYLLSKGWKGNLVHKDFFTDPSDAALSYHWTKAFDYQKKRDEKGKTQ